MSIDALIERNRRRLTQVPHTSQADPRARNNLNKISTVTSEQRPEYVRDTHKIAMFAQQRGTYKIAMWHIQHLYICILYVAC